MHYPTPKNSKNYQNNLFTPPGKIEVDIDVCYGQPVVHKARKNSPLENILRTNDIVVAIDDKDASCFGASPTLQVQVWWSRDA